MSGLQDDWKDVRNLTVGITEEDNAHQTLSEARWIAYLLRTEFDGVAVGITIAVMVVMVLVVANSLGLFESET